MKYLNVPARLRNEKQWVLWAAIKRPDGKTVKRPLDRRGISASFIDQKNWLSFYDAVAAAQKHKCGIGFVLTDQDPFVGIDLDNIDPHSAKAKKLVRAVNSYAEISPSGKGVRVIFESDHQPTFVKRELGIEVYSSKRFLTITGNRLNGRGIERFDKLPKQWLENTRVEYANTDTNLKYKIKSVDDFKLPIDAVDKIKNASRSDGDDMSEIGFKLSSVFAKQGLSKQDALGLFMNPDYGIYDLQRTRARGAEWLARYIINPAFERVQGEYDRLQMVPELCPVDRVNALVNLMMKCSLYPVQTFAFASVFSALSALFGGDYAFSGVRPNIYMCVYGPTGCGKQFIGDFAKKICHHADSQSRVFGEFGSDAALETALVGQKDVLIMVDEFSHFIEKLETHSWARTFKTCLLKLYSSSNSYYLGSVSMARSGGERVMIEHPCVSVLATGLKDSFLAAGKERDLHDGFLNRFIVLSGKPPLPRRGVPEISFGDEFDWLKTLHLFSGAADVDRNKPIIVEADPQVEEMFYDVLVSQTDNLDASVLNYLRVRMAENAKKIAMLLAIAESPDSPTVSMDIAEWSIEFVSSAVDSFQSDLSDYIHVIDESREVQEIKSVESYIERLISDYKLSTTFDSARELERVKRREISYYRLARISKFPRRKLAACLESLVDAGKIKLERGKRGGSVIKIIK